MFRGDSTNAESMTVNEWLKIFELLGQIYNWGPQAKLGALLSKLESGALTHTLPMQITEGLTNK